MYVLLNQQLELQRQMLTTQTMANSLLVLLNMSNEDMLVKKANGSMPS